MGLGYDKRGGGGGKGLNPKINVLGLGMRSQRGTFMWFDVSEY